jgi:uncharacterized protein (DUF1697 family)
VIRVAFLRAVNLGRRRVVNARLVELFEGLGYRDVWTHINSGNVVFDAAGSRSELEAAIAEAVEADVGFEVTTFVRTAAEIDRLVAADPFAVGPGDTWFVTFLKTPPTRDRARALEALSNEFDTLVVEGRDVHWRMHGRSTESRLSGRHWAAIVGDNRSTSRNMNVLRKLAGRIGAGPAAPS